MKLDNVEILLSDARGIYIPRDFVQGFDLTRWEGISESDIEILQDPENEWYWDSWESVLNNARFTADDGRVFSLWQDGDLFAICYEEMTDEEKHNFGFDL